MIRDIYGVNRFYDKTKMLDKTDWFFDRDQAVFATTQKDSSRFIVNAIYFDSDESDTGEPWIEIIDTVRIR